MNVSRLLGATMVAGAGPSGGGRANQSAAPAAPARRTKPLRRARARQDSRPAPRPGRSISEVDR
jgi:hypothetical protein